MPEITRIYLDMDGVLCDFDKRADETGCRKAPGKDPGAIDWSIPKATGPDWWATMDWTPGGREFFRKCREMCDAMGIELGILTAIEIPTGVKGKCLWVHWNTDIDNEHLIIVRKGTEKTKFAAPGRILVDDTPKNVNAFRAAGGEAVLYNNPEQAISDIVALI